LTYAPVSTSLMHTKNKTICNYHNNKIVNVRPIGFYSDDKTFEAFNADKHSVNDDNGTFLVNAISVPNFSLVLRKSRKKI